MGYRRSGCIERASAVTGQRVAVGVYEGRGDLGGSKVDLMRIILGLLQRGFQVNLIVGATGWFSNALDQHGVGYTVIQEPKEIHAIRRDTPVPRAILALIKSLPQFARNLIRISRLLKDVNVIVINEPRSILFLPMVLLNKRTHCIAFAHGEFVCRGLGKLLYNRADVVVAVSEAVKKHLLRSGVRCGKIVVVPNYSTGLSDGGQVIHNLEEKLRKPTLAVIGSIQPIKGQLDAVEMMPFVLEKIPNAVLLLVGPTAHDACDYESRIRQRVAQLGISEHVVFVGPVEETSRLLEERVSDILMPSSTEGMPLTAIEACGRGVPVIGYSVGGLPEIVTDGVNGFLVQYGDVAGLAASIVTLFENRETYAEYCLGAYRVWKNKCSPSVVWPQIESVFCGNTIGPSNA